VRILWIGFLYGMYSEGFDRLWTKHLLDSFTLPLAGVLQPVAWFGLLRAAGLLLATGATEIVQRKQATENSPGLVRALFFIAAILIAGLFTFTLARSFALAALAYLVIYVARNVTAPLYSAWVNQRLDSGVRATVLSMSSQVDAIGQIAGGPLVGLIGNLISVRAALFTSSLILTPVLALYRSAMRASEE
jgi:DHA3 family tetracycline resistance protein-like MFS transporter